MPDHRGSRFALEVLLLVALAVGLTLAELQPLEIGGVVLLGWLDGRRARMGRLARRGASGSGLSPRCYVPTGRPGTGAPARASTDGCPEAQRDEARTWIASAALACRDARRMAPQRTRRERGGERGRGRASDRAARALPPLAKVEPLPLPPSRSRCLRQWRLPSRPTRRRRIRRSRLRRTVPTTARPARRRARTLGSRRPRVTASIRSRSRRSSGRSRPRRDARAAGRREVPAHPNGVRPLPGPSDPSGFSVLPGRGGPGSRRERRSGGPVPRRRAAARGCRRGRTDA